ncbi:hypothetical protein CR513_24846, partial [Mucuna pruriens]
MSTVEWTRHLDEASEKSICWYPQWNEREDTIIRCGGFPNVPLRGTQGAINYNPELVPRQAGYPMALPPSEEAITPFVIHDLGVNLTFEDPRLSTNKESDPSHARPYGSSKRKLRGNLEHPRREDANKRACLEKESWSRAIAQERYFREIERDQALTKKEKLKVALADSWKKEVEGND